MKTKIPIKSIMKSLEETHDLFMKKRDGKKQCWMVDRRSGHKIELHDRQGVFFMKVKLLPPKPRSNDPSPSFHRRGT